MTVTRLVRRQVEKVWGRRDLPDPFGRVEEDSEPIGEIWFEHPDGRDIDLLVKYLFTSERLSIQVHPDEAMARRSGARGGKDEAWIVLAADPGSAIGLGLKTPVTKAELREAALDGRIERLLDWRPVQQGEVFYSPAGTIHALGAGLVVVEIQQNVDLTYRLYDYGRPRELHIEQAIAAAHPVPHRADRGAYVAAEGREVLAHGRAFVVERWLGPMAGTLQPDAGRPVWLVPIKGAGEIGGASMRAGESWLVEGPSALSLEAEAEILAAYHGGEVVGELLYPES